MKQEKTTYIKKILVNGNGKQKKNCEKRVASQMVANVNANCVYQYILSFFS